MTRQELMQYAWLLMVAGRLVSFPQVEYYSWVESWLTSQVVELQPTTMEERFDVRIGQFEKIFDEKTKALDEIFATLFERQTEIERLSELKHDATLELIDHKNSLLKNTTEKTSTNSKKTIESKIHDSDEKIESGINCINQRLNNLEEVLIREKERLDKLQKMSGMTIDEIELKIEDRDRNIKDKILSLEEKLEQLTSVIESVQGRLPKSKSGLTWDIVPISETPPPS